MFVKRDVFQGEPTVLTGKAIGMPALIDGMNDPTGDELTTTSTAELLMRIVWVRVRRLRDDYRRRMVRVILSEILVRVGDDHLRDRSIEGPRLRCDPLSGWMIDDRVIWSVIMFRF